MDPILSLDFSAELQTLAKSYSLNPRSQQTIIKKIMALSRNYFLGRPDLYRTYLNSSNALGYQSYRLFESSFFEVALIYWYPNSACIPHDHGGKEGAIYVLSGCLDHSIYEYKNAKLHLLHQLQANEGCELYTSPSMIHSVNSLDAFPSISLHVYALPINRMRLFYEPTQTIITVKGSTTATFPQDPSNILETCSFQERPNFSDL